MTLHYVIAASEKVIAQGPQRYIPSVRWTGSCRVDWQCRFDQGEMSDEQTNAIADRNLNVLLDSLASYLESRNRAS